MAHHGDIVDCTGWDEELYMVKKASDENKAHQLEQEMASAPQQYASARAPANDAAVQAEMMELFAIMDNNKAEPVKREMESADTLTECNSESREGSTPGVDLKIRRTERNRLAARRCRERKKRLLEDLVVKFTELQKENERLRSVLATLLAYTKDKNIANMLPENFLSPNPSAESLE